MPSVSLAEAVVQQTAIIEQARIEIARAEDDPTRRFWADVQLRAISAIDAMCLKRMQQSTYEMLRRQQFALLASLKFPEARRGDVAS